MDSSKDYMSYSIVEPESVASNIYESLPNLVYKRPRAGTCDFRSESPWPFVSGPGHKSHKKRRSKHDSIGRDYKCEHCNKSYLSYPALYTHTKTKHTLDPLPSRSAASKLRKVSETQKQSNFAEYFELPERKGITKEILETFIKVIERLNNKFNWSFENLEDHPLVKVLKREGTETTCDWVLLEYCKSAAKLTNIDYFEKVCLVVLAYRECINKYGWQKFSDYYQEEVKSEQNASDSPRIETILEYNGDYQTKIREEYSASNDSERIPELANEFILFFTREYELGIDEQEIIGIMLNMCNWMYINKYTKTQVSFIN